MVVSFMIIPKLFEKISGDEFKRSFLKLFGLGSMIGIDYNRSKHGEVLIPEERLESFLEERLELLHAANYLFHNKLASINHSDDQDTVTLVVDKKRSQAVLVKGLDNGRPQVFLPKALFPIADCEFQQFIAIDDALLMVGWSCYSNIKRKFIVALNCSARTVEAFKRSRQLDLGFYDEKLKGEVIQTEDVEIQSSRIYPEVSSGAYPTLSGEDFHKFEELGVKYSGDLINDLSRINMSKVTHADMAKLTLLAAGMLCARDQDAASLILEGGDAFNEHLEKEFG